MTMTNGAVPRRTGKRPLSVPAFAAGDCWAVIETPVGDMVLAGNDTALHHVLLPATFDAGELEPDRAGTASSVRAAAEQISAYFRHDLEEFDLPLEPAGSRFQREVWFALADIPYGETESYASLAARVGRAGAFRAVGATNGRNPLPLVLACHRVIGSDGSLTGYGGGIELKRTLLAHEGWCGGLPGDKRS